MDLLQSPVGLSCLARYGLNAGSWCHFRFAIRSERQIAHQFIGSVSAREFGPEHSFNVLALYLLSQGKNRWAICGLEKSLAIQYKQLPFQKLLIETLKHEQRWETYEKKGQLGLDIVDALESSVSLPSRHHPEIIKKTFDRLAEQYDARVASEFYREDRAVAEKLGPILKTGMRVLDLGCGTGRLGQLLAQSGIALNITGVDVSEPMLTLATATNAYSKLVHQEMVEFLQGGTELFDLVLMASVLPFLGTLDGLVRAIAARQAAGGLLVFSFDLAEAPVQLCDTGRFAHSESYVRSVLQDCGYRVAACESFQARIERARPVQSAVISAVRLNKGRQ